MTEGGKYDPEQVCQAYAKILCIIKLNVLLSDYRLQLAS